MRNWTEQIGEMIDKVDVSMIGSVGQDGFPNMKAMLPPRKRVGIKEIYFTTNTSSMRVNQYLNNPKASVYFFDNRNFQGILLKGLMEVLTDTQSKEEIWKNGDEIYYPLGVTDPDYCVLKFTGSKGRYYSNFHSEDFLIE